MGVGVLLRVLGRGECWGVSRGLSIERKLQRQKKNRHLFAVGILSLGAYEEGAFMEKGGFFSECKNRHFLALEFSL